MTNLTIEFNLNECFQDHLQDYKNDFLNRQFDRKHHKDMMHWTLMSLISIVNPRNNYILLAS